MSRRQGDPEASGTFGHGRWPDGRQEKASVGEVLGQSEGRPVGPENDGEDRTVLVGEGVGKGEAGEARTQRLDARGESAAAALAFL